MRRSCIADRNQLSAVSGPDSSFDGYAVTLIRIHELEEDVKNHPDGSGDLTEDQEVARREYVAVLRKLWEEQHNMLLGLATTAAAITIDKPLRIIGDIAKPITGPLVTKASETKNAVFNFIKNSWSRLADQGNKISILDDFVKNSRNKNLSTDEIKSILLQKGYAEEQLTDLFLKDVQLRVKNTGSIKILTDTEINSIVDSRTPNTNVGNFLAEGNFGVTYKKSNSIFKISKYSDEETQKLLIGDRNVFLNQIEALMEANGQANLPKFYGLILNSKGEIIGFEQEFIEGVPLFEYISQGGKINLDQLKNTINNLEKAHEITGIPHADLGNADNILVENTNGSIILHMIDYGSYIGKNSSSWELNSGIKRDFADLLKTLTAPADENGQTLKALNITEDNKEEIKAYLKSVYEQIYGSGSESIYQKLIRNAGLE